MALVDVPASLIVIPVTTPPEAVRLTVVLSLSPDPLVALTATPTLSVAPLVPLLVTATETGLIHPIYLSSLSLCI